MCSAGWGQQYKPQMFFKFMSWTCSSSPTKPTSRSKPFPAFSSHHSSQSRLKKEHFGAMKRTQSKRQRSVFRHSEEVKLLVVNIPVGRSILTNGNNGHLCRKLHGQKLISGHGQDLKNLCRLIYLTFSAIVRFNKTLATFRRLTSRTFPRYVCGISDRWSCRLRAGWPIWWAEVKGYSIPEYLSRRSLHTCHSSPFCG